MELYYGLNGVQYDEQQIAQMLGISYQRVGQIRNNAFKALRKVPGIKEFACH